MRAELGIALARAQAYTLHQAAGSRPKQGDDEPSESGDEGIATRAELLPLDEAEVGEADEEGEGTGAPPPAPLIADVDVLTQRAAEGNIPQEDADYSIPTTQDTQNAEPEPTPHLQEAGRTNPLTALRQATGRVAAECAAQTRLLIRRVSEGACRALDLEREAAARNVARKGDKTRTLVSSSCDQTD